MILIIGLGNPGEKYAKTRHNFGKEAVKKIAEDFKFPKFRLKKKLKVEISQGKIGGQKVILALPTTYMNESGLSVKKLIVNYRLLLNNLWVIHDDLDLPFDKIKISVNRSAAGHQGVQSIIDTLGSKNFVRFRMGIGPRPENIPAEKFVLEKFNFKEKLLLSKIIQEAAQVIQVALEQEPAKAMSKFN